MRRRELILSSPPCEVDYTDSSIQTISNIITRGPTPCTNLEECFDRGKEGIQCTRRIAQQMAGFILKNRLDFSRAVKQERTEWVEGATSGRFWVNRDGKWQIIQGKENVADDIVAFAETIIDRRPGERRSFMRDSSYQISFGPAALMYDPVPDFHDLLGGIEERTSLY